MTVSQPRRQDPLRDILEDALAEAFEAGIVLDAVVAQSQAQAAQLWRLRESLPEAQKHEGGSIKNDVSVPLSRVAEFIDRASRTVEEALPGIRVVAFGHLGDGNIHFNLSQPVGMDRQPISRIGIASSGWSPTSPPISTAASRPSTASAS